MAFSFRCTSLHALGILHFAFPGLYAYQWPSPQYDALERMLYEGSDQLNFPVADIAANCPQGSLGSSELPSVAAQWLRFAYHDMSTHNITDGTGGLDASLYFELDRPENIGAGMTSTALDFAQSSSKYVSRSDLIAMGAIFGVAACGGPQIPFRGGRIDALVAGPAGVPEPQQDLATHTEKFRLQGFTPTEMISLVACGHTIGGVRGTDFPDAVQASSDTEALSNFDSTGAYDSTIVSEYLNGLTKNPLVRPINATFASDLRIFGSDNNATMKSIQPPAAFADACSKLLERMINTVPAGVELTDEITLLPQKVWRAELTVHGSQLIFDVILRLAETNSTSIPIKRVVQLFWCDARGDAKDCGSGIMNVGSLPRVSRNIIPSPVSAARNANFFQYHFTVPISANRSVSRFWFSVDDKNGSSAAIYDNDGHGYWIDQDVVIFAPELSTTFFSAGANTVSNKVVVGIRKDSNPTSAKMSTFDNTNPMRFPTPHNVTVDLVHNITGVVTDGYMYYFATVDNNGRSATSADFVVVGNDSVVYTADYVSLASALFSPDLVPLSPLSTVSTAPLMLSSPNSSTSPTVTSTPSHAVRLGEPRLLRWWITVFGIILIGILF